MQSVAVGWQIYEITKRPLDLGLVGLAQFLPGILPLVSGHAADRLDCWKPIIACYAGFGVCSSLAVALSPSCGIRTVFPIYAVVVILGIVRSF